MRRLDALAAVYDRLADRVVVTIMGALGAFVVFQNELSRRQVDYLADYVRERSSNVAHDDAS